MERSYTVAHYRMLIEKIRAAMPRAALSTDVIAGFPTETADDHRRTLDVMREIGYDGAFMFKYSPRENTPSFRMTDDVPDAVKTERVTEIIEQQGAISSQKNQAHVGQTVEVLVEGESRKSPLEWQGRTDGNKMVIFPRGTEQSGEYHLMTIERANSATLFGRKSREHRIMEAA
jgi:tRNA-2-methylthio-N6-dimethylallyladenosine synthase